MGSFVSFCNVTKKYGSFEGITDFSFNLHRGERVGLFGLNGSGKTTTLKLLSGLLQPTSGVVTIDSLPPKNCRSLFAFLSDKITFLPWMSLAEIDRLLKGLFPNYRSHIFWQLVKHLDVPRQKVGQMSKGQLQRLKISTTLALDAIVYLLDEPLAGIDVISRQKINASIISSVPPDGICVVSTHEIRDVSPMLNRGFILSKGQLLKDISYDPEKQDKEFLVSQFVDCIGKEESTALQ